MQSKLKKTEGSHLCEALVHLSAERFNNEQVINPIPRPPLLSAVSDKKLNKAGLAVRKNGNYVLGMQVHGLCLLLPCYWNTKSCVGCYNWFTWLHTPHNPQGTMGPHYCCEQAHSHTKDCHMMSWLATNFTQLTNPWRLRVATTQRTQSHDYLVISS